MRTWRIPLVATLALLAHVAFAGEPTASEPTTAQPPAPSATAPSPPAPSPPELNRLLRVPLSTDLGVQTREELGGKDRAEWEKSFSTARREIAELESRIGATQTALRERAPDDWGFTPTGGGGPPVDPEVMKMRAHLKRDKESLEAAHQRERDLEVEASLAGVPDHWKNSD